MATITNDKTLNKVALCSAIFAGFAYVGYSVVRTAFGKKSKRDGDHHGDAEHRLYFRRLSQTTQTDVLLGNMELNGSGKVILRSLTVQERIRELNSRARMFTDTVLAIKASGNGQNYGAARSLQVSPWSSPRIMSPVDVQRIVTSRSSENLQIFDTDLDIYSASPIRRRWMQQTMRSKKAAPASSRNSSKNRRAREETCEEARKMWKRGEDELKARLYCLSKTCTKVLTLYEAKDLVAVTFSKEEPVLEKVLITIGNYGTFAENQVKDVLKYEKNNTNIKRSNSISSLSNILPYQLTLLRYAISDTLREAGCLVRLVKLISHKNINVKLASISAVGNLCLNQRNELELKEVIPSLASVWKQENVPESLTVAATIALTNMAVFEDWHSEFHAILPLAYRLIDKPSMALKLEVLKLLINLSCNEDMIPSLLAAQAPKALLNLLDESAPVDILLRVVTFISNLTQAVKNMKFDPRDLPSKIKAASPDTMYAGIFGINVERRLRFKLFRLMTKHPNEEIQIYCKKIYETLP